MSKNITRLALLAALSLAAASPVSAQNNKVEAQTRTQSGLPKIKMNLSTKGSFSLGAAGAPQAHLKSTPNKYGEEQIVMKEDFAKMTAGTPENPDLDNSILKEEFEYPWINTKDEYFKTPGWGSGNAFSAGGVVYLASAPKEMAHINTPMLNVSANGGIAWVRFKARAKSAEELPVVMVEAAETHNMSPTWDMMGSAQLPQISEQWQEYTMYFYGGGEYTIFNIVSVGAPVYIDDVEVFTVKQHVGTPTMRPYTNYQGTSFDANWTAVEGATGYKVNVFSIDKETNAPVYLFENHPVTTNKFHVTGAESGKTYFYNASATKDSYESIPSAQTYVYDLVAPEMQGVSNFNGSKYTANWSAVPSAERYNYIAYYDRKATQTGEFVVTQEDFTGVKDAEGNLTGWTMEDPSYNSYSELYLRDLKQGGWKGTNYAPYTDYICLDGWQYYHNHTDAGLISPELDMSKDGGKFTVKVKLAGAATTGLDADGKEITVNTQAAFALFNYDETVGDYTQAELIYPEGYPKAVTKDWKEFTINFTKGSKKSIIGIYAVYADEHLYVDDLKITQNYQAGESLNDPFRYLRWVDGTSAEVTVPGFVDQSMITHRVSAYKANSDRNVKKRYAESPFSPLREVGVFDGISNVSLTKALVQLDGNDVCINNAKGEQVQIYTAAGQLVYNNQAGEANLRVRLAARGAYVVKVGNQSVKLVF